MDIVWLGQQKRTGSSLLRRQLINNWWIRDSGHSVAQEIETLLLTEVLLPYDQRCSVEVCCVWMEVLKNVVLVGSGNPQCNDEPLTPDGALVVWFDQSLLTIASANCKD